MDSEKVIYENDIIYIDIYEYKKISNCELNFDGSSFWDEQYGLCYILNDKYKKVGYLAFTIKDPQKFFLAKIKYGI